MRNKDVHIRKNKVKEAVAFCSECGDQLDEFWLTPESKDPAFAKARSEWCKKQGRFVGEMCSKHFISNPDAVIPPLDDSDDEK